MSSVGLFPEAGWEAVYRIRAAVNAGDAELFIDLTRELRPDVSVQVTMIGETLLRQALGNDPAPEVLAGAAAVLTPHLRHFLGSARIDPHHAADLIRTGLRLRECPGWASRAQTMMFFFGFLSPVDDADFLEFRLRSEPLWAKAVEDHLR